MGAQGGGKKDGGAKQKSILHFFRGESSWPMHAYVRVASPCCMHTCALC